jgi:ABC-type nitrate/sulfonate/bicarbonate transport system substrate-binding protein
MKMSGAVLFFAVFLALFLPLPAGCEEKGSVIKICYPNKAQYAPFIIAKETEAWKKNGLEVTDIVSAGGGVDAAEALVAGEADIAAMGDVPSLLAVSRNVNLRILSCYMTGEHMHRIVVSPSSGIVKPVDFIRKKIAVHAGSSTHGGLLLYLKKNGIEQKDVTLVPIPPQYFPEAMLKGEVDAIAGSEPWPQNVLDKNPAARQFATLGGLGNHYPHMILTRNDFVQSRPEESKIFLRVIAEIEIMLRDRPEEAAKLIARSTGRPWEKELAAISEIQWNVGIDETIEKSLTQTAEFLLAEGKLKKLPEIRSVIREQ